MPQTVKSENITNLETLPGSFLDRKVGVIKTVIDQRAVATADINEVGDVILFGPLPSNAILLDVEVMCDDLDSNGTPTLAHDVGLFYSGIGSGQRTQTSGTVISAGCIGTAVNIAQAARTSFFSVGYEARDIINIKKEAWEVAGLTSDPGGFLYVGLTATAAAATAAAGDIVMKITYIERS